VNRRMNRMSAKNIQYGDSDEEQWKENKIEKDI